MPQLFEKGTSDKQSSWGGAVNVRVLISCTQCVEKRGQQWVDSLRIGAYHRPQIENFGRFFEVTDMFGR